jgi:hypothetical protein
MTRFTEEALLMVSDERIRFYSFARLHGLDSGELLEKCHGAGIAIMNQLSTFEPDQRRAIEALINRGDGGPPLSNDGPPLAPFPAGTGPKPRPLNAAARPESTSTDDLK